MDVKQVRAELAEVCRLAYGRGYICATEGNFSVRIDENAILSTPSGTCKGRLSAADLLLTDFEGSPIETVGGRDQGSAGRPSTELAMHLAAYRARPDIAAVAHAHPTVAVGFSVAGQSLAKCILPEAVCTLGFIPVAPYATPSTAEVADSIKGLIERHDALILDHHGALTVGANIWDAFFKLETLEHHARTMLVAHLLGGAKPLTASQVRNLLAIRSIYGLSGELPEAILTGPECCMPDTGSEP